MKKVSKMVKIAIARSPSSSLIGPPEVVLSQSPVTFRTVE